MRFLVKFFNRAKKVVYRLYLNANGAKVSNSIQGYMFLYGNFSGLQCGKNIWIESGAKLILGNPQAILKLDDFIFINTYSIIDCHFNIKIGKRVQIGPNCYITDFDHDLVVDLNRAFHRGDKKLAAVVIEDNVWIGAHVTILKGVTIGKNAVVAAGSVVTKNVSPNTVVAGVPAVFIKEIIYSTNPNS
jgi:acetyltransferase-like isoleucine patch superfamily enzyme